MRNCSVSDGDIRFTEESVNFGGMNLIYAADYSGKTGQFSVSVCKDEEKAKVELGRDFYSAASFYEEVKNGGVTPCTLNDVYQDFLFRCQNVRKPLYNSAVM